MFLAFWGQPIWYSLRMYNKSGFFYIYLTFLNWKNAKHYLSASSFECFILMELPLDLQTRTPPIRSWVCPYRYWLWRKCCFAPIVLHKPWFGNHRGLSKVYKQLLTAFIDGWRICLKRPSVASIESSWPHVGPKTTSQLKKPLHLSEFNHSFIPHTLFQLTIPLVASYSLSRICPYLLLPLRSLSILRNLRMFLERRQVLGTMDAVLNKNHLLSPSWKFRIISRAILLQLQGFKPTKVKNR